MSFVRSVFAPAVRLSRTPRFISRTLATQAPLPTASTSTSTSTPEPLSEGVVGGVEGLAAQPVFPGGDMDVTDSVLKMLESEDGLSGETNSLLSKPISYLPISSLASPNPTLPSPEELAVPLPPTVFAQPLRRDILHRCSVYYLANLRQGAGSSKTRAEVAYSGRKLYRQKGTGKARAGSAGSGTRRGGGTIHGPHPRDFTQLLPRKVRQLGLHVALSSKLSSGLLRIVNDLGEAQWKRTRNAVAALADDKAGVKDSMYEAEEEEQVGEADEQAVNADTSRQVRFGHPDELSILFIAGPPTTEKEYSDLINMARCVNNVPKVEVIPVEEVEAYEILRRKWVVLDVRAVEWLEGEMESAGLAGSEVQAEVAGIENRPVA
ncbi:hypothetical protein FFLO_06168 [Filobasidium floriforme]|uniref:Large ribosomal subunit protein uL4m n=1 Tax=Filobasidium floriforme TaxID=5210 RepID=A0A8K0NN46_9TREE|nr:hypothetical protein FFLO_06168 [Filobasidium floriforme]